MPLQSTSGAASYDAFGGGVAAVPKYIEDYFSTYLVTGDGTAPAVNNGIDLSTKGGLVWIKKRSAAGSNDVFDTARGANLRLITNDTAAQDSKNLSFTTTGFSNYTLDSSVTYASWSWAKAPKFFDVVTFTKSSSPQTISHNLGSTPGCIFIKRTDSTGGWLVAHRGYTGGITAGYTLLNTTDAFTSNANAVTAADSTTFTLGSAVVSGDFVAYLFAHDAGGFGLTGTDNVISCGSYTGVGGGNVATITLGYEPQWILVKRTDNSAGGNWAIFDNMRGMSVNSTDNASMLNPNLIDAESVLSAFKPTATGFQTGDNFTASGGTYIYIAIRRGPMKVPTSGTSVYNAVSRTGTGTAATITGIGFAPDLLDNQRTTAGSYTGFFDRLRGGGKLLYRALDDAETTVTGQTTQFNTTMDGFAVGSSTASDSGNSNTVPYIWHCYKRAPSVFDIVCYTGNGSTQNVNHNLGVAPELIIVKGRNATGYDWVTYASPLGNTSRLLLNSNGALADGQPTWNYTTPTTTQFSLGGNNVNNNGTTFVAYLFATCAGVSKVGSYTGTATTKQIDCGFTGGARFVLIKRTDSTGDWYVWDSARGIVAGNDPYLLLNSTAAEVTNTDYIDTYSAGFEISSTAPAAINASGGTFVFLAIAQT